MGSLGTAPFTDQRQPAAPAFQPSPPAPPPPPGSAPAPAHAALQQQQQQQQQQHVSDSGAKSGSDSQRIQELLVCGLRAAFVWQLQRRFGEAWQQVGGWTAPSSAFILLCQLEPFLHKEQSNGQ